MGYTDIFKLPVNLEKLENCLRGYLVNIEQVGDDEIYGTWFMTVKFIMMF